MKNPGYPLGVPNPFVAHVHPYPTRFHGGVWTRPVFGMPQIPQPSTVFLPPRDIEMGPDKPYQENALQGLGSLQYNVGDGIFRPGGYGGGVFDGNLSGVNGTGIAQGSLGAATQADQDNFPYGKYSAQTKQFQDKINTYLQKKGLCPIVADGKLGPATCGAVLDYRVMGDPGFTASAPFLVPSTCQDFKTPDLASTGCGSGPKPTTSSAPAKASSTSSASISSSLPMSSSTKKILGFIAGGVGAVAVVYYVKKKRNKR